MLPQAAERVMRARVLRLDAAIGKFLADLDWPEGVQAPECDALTVDGAGVLLRLTEHAGAPAEAPGVFQSVGTSPWDVTAAIAQLAEAWVQRHHGDPGTYPTGIKAQVIRRLDMRTAGAWLYSVQLASALADPGARL